MDPNPVSLIAAALLWPFYVFEPGKNISPEWHVKVPVGPVGSVWPAPHAPTEDHRARPSGFTCRVSPACSQLFPASLPIRLLWLALYTLPSSPRLLNVVLLLPLLCDAVHLRLTQLHTLDVFLQMRQSCSLCSITPANMLLLMLHCAPLLLR